MHNYLHCQYLCSYLAARYLLQLYCSLATSYCGSFGVLHYFDYICGLRYDIPQHGVNMLASTTFTGFSAAVLSSICTTAAMQHLLQYFLQHLAFFLCAQTMFPAGINPFRLCFLVLPATLFDGDILLAQLSGLLFCFCFVLQRTNHSEPFASLVL